MSNVWDDVPDWGASVPSVSPGSLCARRLGLGAPTGWREPEGAKEIRNESVASARVLIVSTNADPDVTEYPDTGKAGHIVGGELRVHRVSDAVEHTGPE